MSRARRALAAAVALAASFSATTPAHANDAGTRPTPAPRSVPEEPSYFLEAGLGLGASDVASETILPKAAKATPFGGGPSLAAGLLLGSFAIGPRFAWDFHFDGSHAQTLLADVRWEGCDHHGFSLRLGFGYAWFHDLDLSKLDLGTYDGSGFAIAIGPRFSWLVGPNTTLGVGFRNHIWFVTRPALGPCDDEHGCNGVFYPDERAGGAIMSLGLEVVLNREL